MIYGTIKNQQLDIRAAAAADTIDYLTADFSFLTSEWNGLVKYAHFKQGTHRYSVQLTDDKVTESDHLNLAEGEWTVYLHGNEYRDGEVIQRVTTNIATFTVEPTGILDGEPFPEVEPSVVEQIEAELSDHEERIESLEENAPVQDVVDANGNSLVDSEKVAHLPDGSLPVGTDGQMIVNSDGDWIAEDVSFEDSTNKVTTLTASSTDVQYPSAKVVYDSLENKVTKETGKGLSENDYTDTDKAKVDGLATVASTGDYDDLINTPTIPEQIQSDWNQSDTTAKDFIKNKPTIVNPVQSDWNQADSSALDYIKNKPSIPSIVGLEETANKVTSLSAQSTDTQYPSAKCIYDLIGGLDDLIGTGVIS